MNNKILNELIKKWENECKPDNLTLDQEKSKLENAEYKARKNGLNCCIDDLKILIKLFK